MSDDELRVVLYSHDSQGLGHTRRNLALARSLAQHLPAQLQRLLQQRLRLAVATLAVVEEL